MTDQQFNKLMNVLLLQATALYGIHQSLQAMNIKDGAQPGVYNLKDIQKMLDAMAASVKVPG